MEEQSRPHPRGGQEVTSCAKAAPKKRPAGPEASDTKSKELSSLSSRENRQVVPVERLLVLDLGFCGARLGLLWFKKLPILDIFVAVGVHT
eukprot:2138700-Amphidinium_carterae.1